MNKFEKIMDDVRQRARSANIADDDLVSVIKPETSTEIVEKEAGFRLPYSSDPPRVGEAWSN